MKNVKGLLFCLGLLAQLSVHNLSALTLINATGDVFQLRVDIIQRGLPGQYDLLHTHRVVVVVGAETTINPAFFVSNPTCSVYINSEIPAEPNPALGASSFLLPLTQMDMTHTYEVHLDSMRNGILFEPVGYYMLFRDVTNPEQPFWLHQEAVVQNHARVAGVTPHVTGGTYVFYRR